MLTKLSTKWLHGVATAVAAIQYCCDQPCNMWVAGCKNSHAAFIWLTQRNISLDAPFHLLTVWQQSLFTDSLSQQLWRNAERGRSGKYHGHLTETQTCNSTTDFLGGLWERLSEREPDERLSGGEGWANLWPGDLGQQQQHCGRGQLLHRQLRGQQPTRCRARGAPGAPSSAPLGLGRIHRNQR